MNIPTFTFTEEDDWDLTSRAYPAIIRFDGEVVWRDDDPRFGREAAAEHAREHLVKSLRKMLDW